MALTPTEAARLSHDWIADTNFFHQLDAEDGRIAAAVKAAGCPTCGGRLDRADYPRKPRGGEVGVAGEAIDRRRSFCCARQGCRRRQTPVSLLFLGRRVYLAVTVLVTAWRAASVASRPASPARRTLRRWLAWFAELPMVPRFATVRARLSPSLEPGESLPGALIARIQPGRPLAAAVMATLRLLAPMVTELRPQWRKRVW